MSRSVERALYPRVLALLIGWLPAVVATAPEAPRLETEESPDTRTVERIAAVSVEGVRTIAVEIRHSEPRPDWWHHELVREDDSVVVAIVDESNPDSRWELVAFPPLVLIQQGDLSVLSVEAIHADSVVLMNCDEMYGIHCTCIKQFFDADARKALGHVNFEPLGDSTVLVADNAVYWITEHRRFSPNRDEAIVAQFSPGEPELVYGIDRKVAIATMQGPAAECRTLRQSPILEEGLLDSSITPLTRPSCFVQAASAPPLWTFDFPLGTVNSRGHYGSLSGIAVQDGDSFATYPLPQSMPEDLGRYRRDFQERHPAYARDIDSYTVHESIDAFSLHKTRLWFGTSFDDGEGYTGVGTLGFFDIVRRQYEFIRLPEIADWSTTAILVEEGAVWMGLADHPEGASHSGGLLRYDRVSGEKRIYPIKHVITDILRENGTLYVGAERGRLYVVKDDSFVSSYAVEPSFNGGYEIGSLSIEHLQ